MGLMDWLFGPEERRAVRAQYLSAPPSANSTHASDCAVHNEPAMPNGPCDCWAVPTWPHTIRIGPPPETHKHRMARLIARRERKI